MGKLKIVYPICSGLDVHRDFVVACVATTNAKGVTEYASKRFSTYSGGLRDLRDWLATKNCRDVCMESTGKYWFPVHNILESTCNVVVSHPKFVKAIKGKKTDKKDAQWIADLFKHDLVRGSFIPPEDILSWMNRVQRPGWMRVRRFRKATVHLGMCSLHHTN